MASMTSIEVVRAHRKICGGTEIARISYQERRDKSDKMKTSLPLNGEERRTKSSEDSVTSRRNMTNAGPWAPDNNG